MGIDGGTPNCTPQHSVMASGRSGPLRLGCSPHGDYPFKGDIVSALYFDAHMSANDQVKLAAAMQ